ncbi:MAG: diaminopimelate epimerase, partial [Thermoanaerobaculia bacterium]
MSVLYRLSGGGNDFLALAEPETTPGEERIRAWCSRGLSLGADGLFVLRRRGADVVMDYFNADGRAAELCLNGTRCAARLSRHLGWCDEEVGLITGCGPVRARILDEQRTGLELPAPAAPETCETEVDRTLYRGWFLEVGVPHLVLSWPQGLAEAPVETAGPPLRRHPRFGERGANVDFVRYLPPHRLEIRTFERGVEAETLACGTGVMAAAAVGVAHHGLALPIDALTAGGFTMRVEDAGAGEDGDRWRLSGDARLLAVLDALPA